MGYGEVLLERPVVGICNTASGFNNCHRLLPELIAAVERGVLVAGGLPLVFPTISLGEPFLSPTSLMFRNLMSMDVEEMIRAQPMDAVVLVGGCDKTVPALLMGALSADKPALLVVAGPMMTGRYREARLGACTDCRRFWAEYLGGRIDEPEIRRIETGLATTAGTCPVMGTASTMARLAETLGIMSPGTATIPAVHADRLRAGEASGTRAVALAQGGGSAVHKPERRPHEQPIPGKLSASVRLLRRAAAAARLTPSGEQQTTRLRTTMSAGSTPAALVEHVRDAERRPAARCPSRARARARTPPRLATSSTTSPCSAPASRSSAWIAPIPPPISSTRAPSQPLGDARCEHGRARARRGPAAGSRFRLRRAVRGLNISSHGRRPAATGHRGERSARRVRGRARRS